MANTLQPTTAPSHLVCLACRTAQEAPSSLTRNRPVCAMGHKLRPLSHLRFWSKLMLPFGFLANPALILGPSVLVVAFGSGQYLEIMFWTMYGASILAGLIGIVRSRPLYRSSLPINFLVGESRMGFYKGWLYFAAMVLIVLLFMYRIEGFSRAHPFIMEG